MRNRIFGAVGVLWGGAILVSGLLRDAPQASEAYARGQSIGFVFGGLLFAVGLYYLIKGKRKQGPAG